MLDKLSRRQFVKITGGFVTGVTAVGSTPLIAQSLTLQTLEFFAVYAQGDPGSGIGGYDLKSSADIAFAFDYDSSGKLDHLALYRPGTGTIWIVRRRKQLG